MICQIVIDDNNVITSWSIGGYLDNGIAVDHIPDEVMGGDCGRYKYINGAFIVNPDYTPPEPAPAPAVTMEQRMSATEDAVAEIIEMLMGGESDG